MKSLCLVKDASGEDNNMCMLMIEMKNIPEDEEFTVLAQYTDSDVLLVDGIKQKMRTKLSRSKPRHFYYRLSDRNTIATFLRSHS